MSSKVYNHDVLWAYSYPLWLRNKGMVVMVGVNLHDLMMADLVQLMAVAVVAPVVSFCETLRDLF